MPPAARVGDMHTCPLTPVVPHVGGPVLPPGGVTVLIGGMPAARVGDMCTCVGPPDAIVKGSAGVIICGSPSARIGDLTAHGGVITVGLPTVMIGETGGGGGGGGNVASLSMDALKDSGNPGDLGDQPDSSTSSPAAAAGGGGGGGGAPPPPPPSLPGADAASTAGALNPQAAEQAAAMKEAAQDGTPFVEKCPYAH